MRELRRGRQNKIYDSKDPNNRRLVNNIGTHPLTDEKGVEIHIFNSNGKRIPRRRALVDPAPCGVLMNLENIHTLFHPDREYPLDDDDIYGADPLEQDTVKVDAYPLGFLRTSGNVQATGIPACFYKVLNEINRSVREDSNEPTSSDNGSIPDAPPQRHIPIVRPVSSQFYNYITHRVATRAGAHDAQQGTVTAALAGGFAQKDKDRDTASKKQRYCDIGLPSDRFRDKIQHEDCPTCCRAEIVYSVDVRSMREPCGMCVTSVTSPFYLTSIYRSIFQDIILPLARSWKREDIREVIKHYLTVLTPNVCSSSYSGDLII